MQLKGYVVNNSGRGKHRFKQNVAPGARIPLETLYEIYKSQYSGSFSLAFIRWLESEKFVEGDGFSLVLTEVNEEIQEPVTTVSDVEDPGQLSVSEDLSKILPNNLTAKQLSELKIKDNPRKVIKSIMSVHKLRRALTLCKGRAGKETLLRLIRDRIAELAASGFGVPADAE